jgi:RHS repeat-associated protein
VNKGSASQAEYAYDGLNQRVWTNKLPSATAAVPNPTTLVKTYEIYSSNGQLLVEYSPSLSKVDEHIYLGTKRIGLASRTGAAASVTTHFHLDPAATPLLATTAAGTVAWKENHRPYGDKLNYQAAAASNTIGYAGKPFDNATGLSYMGARYYNPVLGRFTGIDPVGFTEANIHSHNRYTYANNNPYKFVDPDGRYNISPLESLHEGIGSLGGGAGGGGGRGGIGGSPKGAGTVANSANNAATSVRSNVAPAQVSKEATKTYQTYTKENSKTNEIYSGRCSGCKSAEENVAQRDANHHMTQKGFGPAQLDQSSTNKDAIRGREQQMIESNGGAKSMNGTSGNAINGIAPSNPKGDTYRGAANEAFGETK